MTARQGRQPQRWSTQPVSGTRGRRARRMTIALSDEHYAKLAAHADNRHLRLAATIRALIDETPLS